MVSRADSPTESPDLGVLAARLLFAIQDELYAKLAQEGFDDLHPRHGAVLAYIADEGMRATEIARLSGQHKQVIGTVIDELEALGYVRRCPDPNDRRAKLVCRTDRGRDQKRAGDRIMNAIGQRHVSRLGADAYQRFIAIFINVVEHQRESVSD